MVTVEDDDPIDFAAEADRVAHMYAHASEEDLAEGIHAALVNLYELLVGRAEEGVTVTEEETDTLAGEVLPRSEIRRRLAEEAEEVERASLPDDDHSVQAYNRTIEQGERETEECLDYADKGDHAPHVWPYPGPKGGERWCPGSPR